MYLPKASTNLCWRELLQEVTKKATNVFSHITHVIAENFVEAVPSADPL